MLTQSYASAGPKPTPVMLAKRAFDLVAAAAECRSLPDEQRGLIREARAVVADLGEALDLAAFNENDRFRCKQASDMLRQAARNVMRPFSLTYAQLCLEKIAGN